MTRTSPRAKAALIILLALVVFAVVPAGAADVSRFDAALLATLNQVRAAHGLTPLVLDASLDSAARLQSRDMIAGGYFSHASADGDPFYRRLQHYDPAARHGGALGENLFWGPARVTPAAAVSAWMASPKHRANILDPRWRVIGIAALASRDAPGVFGQRAVTVITTDFATRS